MSKRNDDLPACFGDLEKVFPISENGLRATPDSCMLCCHHKTECLKEGMSEKPVGLKTQEDLVDRAYSNGLIGFFERWSRKKDLNRKIDIKKNNKG